MVLRKMSHRRGPPPIARLVLMTMAVLSTGIQVNDACAAALDRGFGREGRVVTAYRDEESGPVTSLARSADGSTLVVGHAESGPAHVWRYSASGALFRAFRRGPEEPFPAFLPEGSVSLPDGRVALAGFTGSQPGVASSLGLAVMTSSLQADMSFGSGGVVTVPGRPELLGGRAVLADREGIYVGGTAVVAGAYRLAVARFDWSGHVDARFGEGGVTIPDVAGTNDAVVGTPSDDAARTAVNALVRQRDGKLLVMGTGVDAASGRDVGMVLRLDPQGSVDPSWAPGRGAALISFASACPGRCRALGSQVRGGVLQGEKLVVAGALGNGSIDGDITQARFGLARLTSAGEIDRTFGARGLVATDQGGSTGVNVVVPTLGGRLLAAGGVDSAFALARYRANGTLDRGWGADGRACTNFFDDNNGTTAVRGLQRGPRGSVVAGGGTDYVGDASYVLLARYRARAQARLDCLRASKGSDRRHLTITGILGRRATVTVVLLQVRSRGPNVTLGRVKLGRRAPGLFTRTVGPSVSGHRLRKGVTYQAIVQAANAHGATTTIRVPDLEL